MEDKTHKILELVKMMAAGHSVETVMAVMNIDDEELYELMISAVEISEASAPPAPKIQVQYMIEILRTESAGKVEVNLNQKYQSGGGIGKRSLRKVNVWFVP